MHTCINVYGSPTELHLCYCYIHLFNADNLGWANISGA